MDSSGQAAKQAHQRCDDAIRHELPDQVRDQTRGIESRVSPIDQTSSISRWRPVKML